MNFNWQDYRQKIPSFFSPGKHFLTLMEYEFPLLFISSAEESLYLNYFIDEDECGIIRYLHVPISIMKIRALASGGIALYDCINAENIHIYDLNQDGNVSFVAELDFSNIPTDALPPKEEKIPALSKDIINSVLYGFDPGELCFILSSKTTSKHTLSFNKLSNFLKTTQNLVSKLPLYNKAVDRCITSDDYELSAVALKAASFAVTATTENESAKNAISTYIPEITNLFLKSSPDDIRRYFDLIPKELILAFFEYYKEILSNKYEFILQHKSGSMYLNYSDVEKIKRNVNNANYSKKEYLEKEGYLIGANLNTNSFYFEDIEKNIYKGKMSSDFLTSRSEVTLSKITCNASFKIETEMKFSKFTHFYELLKIDESDHH
ncbi:MAG: hypothetical protein CDV28_10397 [Candidatus Electronema aureum]|uniref:Uncharacterized protein n=1 Tax=Candidatus Electronema aureum TaxID=2005002 RepID=A0A521G4A6_9BACT|nr:MAG: hypothetical protein CDV28_10397 [Candidatus Electronema aureum]